MLAIIATMDQSGGTQVLNLDSGLFILKLQRQKRFTTHENLPEVSIGGKRIFIYIFLSKRSQSDTAPLTIKVGISIGYGVLL